MYTTTNMSTSTSTSTNVTMGWAMGAGVAYTFPEVPQAKPQSPLEWLDSEVEKTCAVARRAA